FQRAAFFYRDHGKAVSRSLDNGQSERLQSRSVQVDVRCLIEFVQFRIGNETCKTNEISRRSFQPGALRPISDYNSMNRWLDFSSSSYGVDEEINAFSRMQIVHRNYPDISNSQPPLAAQIIPLLTANEG